MELPKRVDEDAIDPKLAVAAAEKAAVGAPVEKAPKPKPRPKPRPRPGVKLKAGALKAGVLKAGVLKAGMVTAANVQDLPKFLALVTGDGKFRALKIIEHSPKADRYPAQTDNSSCGVFALAALMHLLRGARINFKQADMAEWRSFVAAKICAMRTEGE